MRSSHAWMMVNFSPKIRKKKLINASKIIVQDLQHQRWLVVGKDHTMEWVFALHCQACAQTEMSMCFGMHFIHQKKPTDSLWNKSWRAQTLTCTPWILALWCLWIQTPSPNFSTLQVWNLCKFGKWELK